jgi:CheY-like chemotaxis protein
VISASIERQLAGKAYFEWGSDGLHFSLSMPRGEKIGPMAHRSNRPYAIVESSRALPLRVTTGNRIFLVEDEILVAMMMRDILTDLGFTVVGPYTRLSEAMMAAVHDKIDAAIVDVNLDGQMVYPLADVLVARKIPFVFVTGYGVESIDGRFGYVPVIKKPVQRKALEGIFRLIGVSDLQYGTA